jgi:hypothetical protein
MGVLCLVTWCVKRILLLGILIFKGLTARRLCKSLGVKGLMKQRDQIIFKLGGGTLLLEHFPEEVKKKHRTFSQFSV